MFHHPKAWILLLRLVNESGDPFVEQAREVGVHSMEVGSKGSVATDISDNPDTASKPRSINTFLVFYKR
jgi:hypothetical protein